MTTTVLLDLVDDAIRTVETPEPHFPTIRKALLAARRELVTSQAEIEFRARQLELLAYGDGGKG